MMIHWFAIVALCVYCVRLHLRLDRLEAQFRDGSNGLKAFVNLAYKDEK